MNHLSEFENVTYDYDARPMQESFNAMTAPLPSFTNPPLVETAISIQFPPIRRFGNVTLADFWNQKAREEYPLTVDAAPIPDIDPAGVEALQQVRFPSFRIVPAEGTARLQMMSADKTAMIQLQNGRLVYNWRKFADTDYPRWEKVIAALRSAYNSLGDLLASRQLGQVEPTQWEVVYVNNLYKGKEWNELKDVDKLLPGLAGNAFRTSQATAESIGCNYLLILPEALGRLHLELVHGVSSLDPEPKEALILRMTARGILQPNHDIFETLANARASIVRTFTEVTSADAQALWGREP